MRQRPIRAVAIVMNLAVVSHGRTKTLNKVADKAQTHGSAAQATTVYFVMQVSP